MVKTGDLAGHHQRATHEKHSQTHRKHPQAQA
jgi:hypothetical protein